MGVEFDPEKASANLRKHRVSFAHAEQALHDDQAITVEDPDAEGERRYISLGMDALGRVLVVVHTAHGTRHTARGTRPQHPFNFSSQSQSE